MGKSYDIDLTEYVPFERVTDEDLLKARLFNQCRMSETGCWEWTGTKRNGYGLMWFESKTRSAHRVSYEAFKGPIPTGLHILHRCDNPGCINPAHLRAGTIKENAIDRETRGRRDVKGEQIGTSKLTEQQVSEIKASSLSNKALAAQYGVRPTHIWRIRSGESWAHVSLPTASHIDGRGKVKLTLEQALAIKNADVSVSHGVLAAKYGVSASTICQIRAGRTWKNLSQPTEDRSR